MKFIIRAECLVEFEYEAESLEVAQHHVAEMECEELSHITHTISEIYDVFEIEEK